MSNLCNLLKIQILSNLKINKIKSKNNRGRVGGFTGLALYLLLFILVFGVCGASYTEMYSETLLGIGRQDELFSVMISLSALVSFFFSFYAISSVLYNFSDYDMLLSMPIKKNQIVLSKLLYSYIVDIAISIFFIAGCLIKYYDQTTFDLLFTLKVIVLTVISPLFALACSMVIGTLFSLFSSLFKRKNLIQIIMYIAFIFGIVLLNILSSDGQIDPTATIGKIYFIYPVLNKALNEDAINVLYYLLICVFGFSLITVIICLFYQKFNGIMTAKKTSRNFKLKRYSRNAQLKTLTKKEFRTLFSSPTYTLNCLLGLVFSIIFAIVAIVIVNSIDFDFSEINGLIRYVPIILVFFFVVAPTTGCSIAMEGKNLWIYKTSPVKSSAFFGAKLLVNYVFYIPTALFVSVALAVCMKLEFAIALLFVVLTLLVAGFSGIYGLFLNLVFPHLEWENENQAVKQGAAVLITVLTSLVLAGLFFVIAYYIKISTLLLFVIYLAFFAIVDIALYYVVFKHGDDILDKRR